MLDASRFSRDVLAALPQDLRSVRLAEMEAAASAHLVGAATLAEFQARLYRLIDDDLVNRLGHFLGRWEYDCEVEYWGGKAYMDPSHPSELLLRSRFPSGVRFKWGVFEFRPWDDEESEQGDE